MMTTLLKAFLITALLTCSVLLSGALEQNKRKSEEFQSPNKNTDGIIKVNYRSNNDKKPDAGTLRQKVRKGGSERVSTGVKRDAACTRLGGICQPKRYVCQGRYLNDKCSESKTWKCCMPDGAWSVLCDGHHNNRVRACDTHGCGAFSSKRVNGLRKAVDLVCDDYGVVNAPFAGSLAGPVSQKDASGHRYDGVKLLSDVRCVKIFNIRALRYKGPVARGEALGYLLPLQERFSGITSHLQLQMCDGSDPSPFL